MAEDLNEQLRHACGTGGRESVLSLISRGADVDSKNGNGRTALDLACTGGHTDIALLLLEKGADIESTLLLLLERGADIESRVIGIGSFFNGYTALHYACSKGHTATALLLLERGADIEGRDSDGLTALHYACSKGHTDTALLLLERGADIESVDSCGNTALHWACRNGSRDTAETPIRDVALALVRAGADTLVTNNRGDSPLDLARSEELKAALVREREKNLAWTRRKAFMVFLAGHKYIRMRHHHPAAGSEVEERLVDIVMRETNTVIASFL